MITIDLMRHGPLEGPPRFLGNTDLPLSDAGSRQMHRACPASRRWDAIYSSPLVRCSDFARELAAGMGLVPIIEPELRATDFGAWEGRTAEEISRAAPEEFHRYRQDPYRSRPPGGESVVDVAARSHKTLLALLNANPGKHLLALTHSNVILTTIAATLGLPHSRWGTIHVGYCAYTRLQFAHSPQGWRGILLFHNGSADGG